MAASIVFSVPRKFLSRAWSKVVPDEDETVSAAGSKIKAGERIKPGKDEAKRKHKRVGICTIAFVLVVFCVPASNVTGDR